MMKSDESRKMVRRDLYIHIYKYLGKIRGQTEQDDRDCEPTSTRARKCAC